MSNWNTAIVEEFRTNEGKVGGHFEGRPLLILHTVGRKSGKERLNPLGYLEDGGRIFVFASKMGASSNPDWYHNVIANPDVTYEIGTETRTATAVELTGGERDAIYAKQAEVWPTFGEYQEMTDRRIPVVELR